MTDLVATVQAYERQIRAYLSRDDASPYMRQKLQDLLSRDQTTLTPVELEQLGICIEAARKHESEALEAGIGSGHVRRFTPRDSDTPEDGK